VRQTRRARPTIQTAHEFHQRGIFSTGPEHSVSDEERERLSEEVAASLERLIKEQYPKSANLEYAILKAHLIVEYAITEYIRCLSDVLVESGKLRFSFSNKLEVAYLMGLGANDPVLLPTIERLNKIRNQVAHTFVLDRPLVDEMLRLNSGDYDDFKLHTDRERVRHLRLLCAFVAGNISAQISVRIYWQIRQRFNGPPKLTASSTSAL